MASTLILVLGMHRSGTSAITKGLEVLGVDLGQHLLAPAADNPKGFFEDSELQGLNEAWLLELGRLWSSVSLPAPERAPAHLLAQFHQRIHQALDDRVNARLWAFKDPRMSRLWPYWAPVFREIGLQVRVLLVLRHPRAVAQSLARRNAMPTALSHLLWRLHNHAAALALQQYGGTVVIYEHLMREPQAQLHRLHTALQTPAPTAAALQAYRAEFLDPALDHGHQTANVEGAADIAHYSRHLWPALLQVPSEPDPAPRLLALLNQTAPGEEALSEVAAYIESKLGEQLIHSANLQHQIDATQAYCASLLQTVDATRRAVEDQKNRALHLEALILSQRIQPLGACRT